jgi:hypothetical protein
VTRGGGREVEMVGQTLDADGRRQMQRLQLCKALPVCTLIVSAPFLLALALVRESLARRMCVCVCIVEVSGFQNLCWQSQIREFADGSRTPSADHTVIGPSPPRTQTV